MKQKILCSILVFVMMLAVAPAFAAEVVQFWNCEMDDDASEQAILDHVGKWLKAAKQVEGGENLEARVLFPVAVNDTGEIDVLLMVLAPSFEDWGKFWDNYGGSAAADVETEGDEILVCPDSTLWESVNLKAK